MTLLCLFVFLFKDVMHWRAEGSDKIPIYKILIYLPNPPKFLPVSQNPVPATDVKHFLKDPKQD